ncbi:MAG: hypothetical protein IPN30_16750 [Flavobacteriales bacterium]|nr:hypothetical protein [Flavobacteriales bacterium]
MTKPVLTARTPYLVGIALLTTLLTWLAWNTNAPHMGLVLTNPSDPLGYYQWLPWTFLHGDWSALPYVHYLPNGNGLSLFTMGVAIMQAPFFLLAWLYCELAGIPATGFELPFVFARLLATSFYGSAGMGLLLAVLLRSFDGLTAWVSAGAILFGTTLYYYTVHEGGMSHVYSFFLITWAIYLTYHMVDAPRWSRLLGLFACVSIILLIRPLNGVILLFVAFAGAAPKASLTTRLEWLKCFPKTMIFGALLALCIWLPQLLYWKMQTGSWFVFTYGKKHESFDFYDPHLFDTLFSFQNGWFIYTPLMLFAFGMLIWQAWKGVGDARVSIVVWSFVWYVYSSWWCWWLGSAFGYRGFLELYALLAIPFAALVQRTIQGRYGRIATVLVLLVLVRLNIRLGHIYQYPWEAPYWDWSKLGDAYLNAFVW